MWEYVKRLALTIDCKITYCIASKENVGKGICDQIDYQKNGKSMKDFYKRIENSKINIEKIKNLKTYDKIKLIEVENVIDEILDILVNDEDEDVRSFIVNHGRDKDLDILVRDKYWSVRAEVAKRGRDKDLDILVNDENVDVCRTVSEYGRCKDLDILINDVDKYVRNTVIKNKNFKYDKRLINNKGRLEMIKEGCSEKDMNFIIKGPKNKEIKLALIEKGIDVEKFLNDRNKEVQKALKKMIMQNF